MNRPCSEILLILDVDETLIHATESKLDIEEDFKLHDYFIYKRPFLDEFLSYAIRTFRTAIWSSATDDYVLEIVKLLGIENELEFIWGRSKATPRIMVEEDDYGNYNLDRPSHFNYAKPLKKIKKKGYDLHKILIVEDTPQKVRDNYGNAIYIKEFLGSKKDEELKKLMNYLDTLKFVENVRTIEKRNWGRN